MAETFNVITFDRLRDAIESLLTLRVSDEELAERGIRLIGHETLREGLGPSAYALIELEGGPQYLLERLDHAPEVVEVSAPLIDDPQPLATRFRKALDVPMDRVEWEASDPFWNESRDRYDRDEWLAQRRRLGEHS